MDEAKSTVVTGDISRLKRGVGAGAQPMADLAKNLAKLRTAVFTVRIHDGW